MELMLRLELRHTESDLIYLRQFKNLKITGTSTTTSSSASTEPPAGSRRCRTSLTSPHLTPLPQGAAPAAPLSPPPALPPQPRGPHLPPRRLLAGSASAPGTSARLRAPLPAAPHGGGSPGPSGAGKSRRKAPRGAAAASAPSAMAAPR